MNDLVFEKFPKIARLKRACVITEKIDGTNAQVVFNSTGDMLCGSRNRILTVEKDNFGFASWAISQKEKLFEVLGEGRHYGEWWGSGIQRGYDRKDRTFSLFNTGRWNKKEVESLSGLSVVPVLYSGDFEDKRIDGVMDSLRLGSIAAPNYGKPEGIIIYHSQIKQLFKRTFEQDESGKGK